MFPIKLTKDEYVNPDAIARVVFTLQGESNEPSAFTAAFTNTELMPLRLYDQQAEEAVANWKAAYEDHYRTEN